MSDVHRPPLDENVNKLDPSKELRLMLAFFGESELPLCEEIPPEEVPEPYHRLLVHENHMTVTIEAHHADRVVVRPYSVHRQGDLYGRKLDLTLGSTGEIIMTGIMLINFSFCSNEVRDLIVEQKTPLGRILIENNILRSITAETFLRINAKDPLVARFQLAEPCTAYGRLATIFCDEKPAVDLLEIVRPEG